MTTIVEAYRLRRRRGSRRAHLETTAGIFLIAVLSTIHLSTAPSSFSLNVSSYPSSLSLLPSVSLSLSTSELTRRYDRQRRAISHTVSVSRYRSSFLIADAGAMSAPNAFLGN